jgi:hypothetical protein
MEPPLTERRRARRFHHADDHGILFARVRPGLDAWVVNASAAGALLETPHRLLPGSIVELAVQTVDRRASTRGLIVRCWVARVQAAAIWYRGAVDFERQIPWLRREQPAVSR